MTESGDKTVTITEFSNGKGSVAFSQKSSGYERTKHMSSEEENFKAMDDAVKSERMDKKTRTTNIKWIKSTNNAILIIFNLYNYIAYNALHETVVCNFNKYH